MRSPLPAPVTLAGVTKLRMTVVMALLALAVAAGSSRPAAAETPAERLQLRLGALAEDPRVAGLPVADPWLLARFYERREFKPTWGEFAKLDQLLDAINGSFRHGLEPGDYHHSALAELVASLREAPTPALATEAELLATDALARLAFHLRFGKVDPRKIDVSWNIDRALGAANPVTALQSVAQADDLVAALDELAPEGEYYAALRSALAAHREIAARGGWPAIEAGETLRVGMRSGRIPPLRSLLAITGDYMADADFEDEELFDEPLETAVMRFQARHGLDADGAVGRQTLAALNVPVGARIDQIRVNLERVRWVFHNLEDRFLLVNIARFRVLLIENRRITWSTRAVVGRPFRQTPVFKARLTYLEFNPTWTVPPTILREDLLPEIRGDATTLQRKNMVVLDQQGQRVDPAAIDWASATARNFPYMIRQEPGPDNALGRVKFMFPNPYHVYMHDTPARQLFARAERAFSSGCIRLEQPFELVRILLAGSEWDDAAIERVLASGRTRVVNLPQPISVLLLYGTVVPEGGQVHFAADVYRRDKALLAALDAPFEFIPPAGYEELLLQ
jgi:L,D-transpeptidase YcbB